ncbi:MAG TPA: TIGR02147 family protein [Chitinivibrionales bacterium]|nr:TIGR02147 family protein [Chitinivibrionales bacterium]
MDKPKSISIYDYTDYRLYLREYYEEQKTKNPAFSYRYFARKAGFNSSGLYKDIVDGRTGITRSLILRFAIAMKLSPKQQEYFETMVYFNEAKTVEEKKLYFERLMKYHNSKAFRVDASQYEYYSRWYYIAVRELLAIGNFKDDYAAIAQALNPTIRQEHAKKAIEVLKKLGLIQKNKLGYYKAVEKILTTGPEIKSLSIANFQKNMMDMAKEALDRHPAEHRNISTVTFSVSQQTYNDIKAELDACRKRILGMVERSENEDRVCQLNMQLFPLTQIKEK